eukprot:COSAG01_NODE_1389_length_10493_cov_12.367414_6_plen_128_part_00
MAATGWTSPTGVWLPVVGAEIRSDKVFCRSPSLRLTEMMRHRKMGHRGPCGKSGCSICQQTFGKLRQVNKHTAPTPARDPIVGNTVYADVIYVDVMSDEGNRYATVLWDDQSGYITGGLQVIWNRRI